MITPVAIMIAPKAMDTIEIFVIIGSKSLILDTQYTNAASIIKIKPTHFIKSPLNYILRTLA